MPPNHAGTTLIDCRWLGRGGAGRATELLLRGLRALHPIGRWVLWGPPRLADYRWPDATIAESHDDPRAMAGQRSLFAVPPHDAALYMHQIRPLRPGRSVTLIHDTIPLHFGPVVARTVKRLYLRRVAAMSDHVLTVSDFSKRSIEADLGVASANISVIRYPVDDEMAARVDALRRSLPREDVVLYVGRFGPHKNLERLIDAFGLTSFRARGGRLLLVGGTSAEVSRLRSVAEGKRVPGIDVRGGCSQDELERLYATSRLLVMPSLEEGFGLPAWEAMSCSLPVCVSTTEALIETTAGRASTFPPDSIDEMARAIDRAIERSPPHVVGPTLQEFAASVVGALRLGAAGPD